MMSTLPMLLLLLLLLLVHLTVGRASAAGAVVAAGKLTTVEIAPGVAMPFANLGGSDGAQSNYTFGLTAGFRGFDTALSYTTGNVQPKLGAAIRRSSLPRADLFVTTKIPCCPAASEGFQHYYCDGHPRSGSNLTVTADADISSTLADIGIEYADLILLHWPCQTIEQTWETYEPTQTGPSSLSTPLIRTPSFPVSVESSCYSQSPSHCKIAVHGKGMGECLETCLH